MSDLQKIITLPYVTGFRLVYSTGGLGYEAIVGVEKVTDASRHGETCDRFLMRTLAKFVAMRMTKIDITVKNLDSSLN